MKNIELTRTKKEEKKDIFVDTNKYLCLKYHV